MTQNLQLRAEVIDNATATLRKIAGDLNRLKTPPGLKNVREEFTGLEKAMRGVSMAGATVFSGIGLGSLSAGAAFAMLANRMKELANRTVLLQQVGRETGLLADQLKALQNLGSRFEIDPKTMLGGIQTFADKMVDIKRGLGATYGELKDIAPGLADQLRKDGNDTRAAFGHAFGWLSQIDDEQLRRRWAGKLFGVPDLSRMFSEGVTKFREEWRKAQDAVGKEPKGLNESAKLFNQSLRDFNDSLDRFETKVGPSFLRTLGGVADEATKEFEKLAHIMEDLSKGDWKSALGREFTVVPGSPLDKLLTNSVGAKKNRLDEVNRQLAEGEANGLFNGAGGMKRNQLLLEKRDLEKAIQEGTAKGAEEGLKKGIEKMSFMSGAGATARLWNASLGGGGFAGGGGPPFGGRGPGSGRPGGASSALAPNGPISQVQGSMKRSDVVDYIREAAKARGIDPNVAVAVARSEGLNGYVGDRGTSFGPFQLHYKNNIPGLSNSGLGDSFTKATGLDARDPSTVRQQIDFALNYAAKNGWGPWHGWRGSRFAGIGPGAKPAGISARGERVITTSDGRRLVVDGNGKALRWADEGGGGVSWPGGWEDRARRLGDMRRGDAFGSAVKLEGGARVDINLTGAGRGTRTSIDNTGIIKSVRLNRGSTMPVATDEE